MYRSRDLLKRWAWLVLSWIAFTSLFSALALTNLEIFIKVGQFEEEVAKNELTKYYISNYQYLESMLFGLIFGSILFFTDVVLDYTHIHKKSFGLIILIKSIFYLLAIVFTFGLIFSILDFFQILPINLLSLLQFVNLKFLFLILVYFSFFIIITNFFLLVNRKFGPGNTWPIFFGKYHKPVVEERIFMFLDLQSSTSLAEKLGHIHYSRMIQDCFHDLNQILGEYKASVYQYVGDEAVITWKIKEGLHNSHCLSLFFAFENKLLTRARHYSQRYGMTPVFKGGLSCGSVTAAEVGDIKREIAYHGDVLNTAARIQELCNEYQAQILISDQLKRALHIQNTYEFHSLGKLHLKGKIEPVEIYSVQLKKG